MDSFQSKLKIRSIKSDLDKLPKGLDAYDVAYNSAMERIFAQVGESRDYARKVISLILCARRPLSPSEIRHALMIEHGDTAIDEDDALETDVIISICAGLVTVDAESNSVSFVHYTTQEYLKRNQERWLPSAEIDVARTCTAYLMLGEFRKGPCHLDALAERTARFSFFEYAARFCCLHLDDAFRHLGTLAPYVTTDALAFLQCSAVVRSAAQIAVSSGLKGITIPQPTSDHHKLTGVHWAAAEGLVNILDVCLEEGLEMNLPDECGMTPFEYACSRAHRPVVDLLLQSGAVDIGHTIGQVLNEIPALDESGITDCLLFAMSAIDINHQSREGRTALSYAAGIGNTHMVRTLMETSSFDANAECQPGRPSLPYCVDSGSEPEDTETDSIELSNTKLSSSITRRHSRTDSIYSMDCHSRAGKINANLPDKTGRTALSYAAERGGESIVRQLLETGAIDVHAKDANGRSALSFAAERGIEAIAQLLLEACNATTHSSSEGSTLLERNGALPDFHSKSSCNIENPVCYASPDRKVTASARYQLGEPVSCIDAQDSMGRTPLSYAAGAGHFDIVELLLLTGKVKADLLDDSGRSPLSHAVQNSCTDAARCLLRHGAATSPTTHDGRTFLSLAAEKGDADIARLLADASDVSLNATDVHGRTALSYAAESTLRQSLEVVKLLCQLPGTTNIDTADVDGKTPLAYAMIAENDRILKFMLEFGLADPDKIDLGTLEPTLSMRRLFLRLANERQRESPPTIPHWLFPRE